MYLSSRGAVLSLLIVASIFVVFASAEIEAQEKLVSARSIGFEETTIIEFENSKSSTSDIDTIRMWLGSDFTFKSFKTEKGWTGKKTPQGVIVFSTSSPLKAGDVVKFGIKTDKPKPGINWKALEKDEQIGTGKTLVGDSTSFEPVEDDSKENSGILKDSIFRLIPEKPNVGSSMRVTGDNFGDDQVLTFYIGDNLLESFRTDDKGHFMISSKVPENQNPGRVDFILKDQQGNEKSISQRIDESQDRMAATKEIPLTISGIPLVVHRGENVTVSGTAIPGGTVTATVLNEEGEVENTIAIPVDLQGNWKYDTLIPIDAPYGKRTAEITDGRETISKTWSIESSKTIEITPIKIKFEPGETVAYNGTALPNKELEIVVEDPQGTEFHSEIINVGSSGEISFQFPTDFSSPQGTYSLIATQDGSTEIVLIGLGELPQVQLIVKMDKLNYAAGEIANVEIQGPTSSTITLLVVDPSDKPKFSESITLGPDGQKTFDLDLTGYSSGVYTIVLTRGNAQADDVFSVGLQIGSGPIEIRTTKQNYQSGESILILGNTSPNALLTLELIDPNDKVVKTKDTFTNKDGLFSESSIRIPTDTEFGTWTLKATSGANFATVEIEVVGVAEEGLIVSVEDIVQTSLGKQLNIKGFGARISQPVVIQILGQDGIEIIELTTFATGVGNFETLWIIPKDIVPGNYTIKATDPVDEAETSFVIE